MTENRTPIAHVSEDGKTSEVVTFCHGLKLTVFAEVASDEVVKMAREFQEVTVANFATVQMQGLQFF